MPSPFSIICFMHLVEAASIKRIKIASGEKKKVNVSTTIIFFKSEIP